MITNQIAEIVSLPIPETAINAIAEFINSNDVHSIENGRYELTDGHFVNVMELDTVPMTEKKLEFHGKYADVQCIVSGKERFLIANTADSTITQPYSAEKDVGFVIADTVQTVDVAEGSFIYFIPGELHGPGLATDEGPCHCKKLIFKVRIG
jgi:YhcH/YjgK/YiaL family protein